MYNHNKAQQSKNRVHISWDILYAYQQRYGFKPRYVSMLVCVLRLALSYDLLW